MLWPIVTRELSVKSGLFRKKHPQVLHFSNELHWPLILLCVIQVEELALNSMIRKSNTDKQLQTENKPQASAKTHTRRKATEVSYYKLYTFSHLLVVHDS